MQRLRTVTSLDVSAVAGHHAMPAALLLINQCQMITFLSLHSDNIENSRTELKGIGLQVPSDQTKVT